MQSHSGVSHPQGPRWIQNIAAQYVSNGYDLDTITADLLTRALAPSPAPHVVQPPKEASFQWIVPPPDEGLPPSSVLYVDGSRLFAEQRYFGMCARQAWALLALDSNGKFVASASGVPPPWAEGIHGAELWALLQAVRISAPDDSYRTDCLSVKLGVDKGIRWASAAERHLGQAWQPLAEALEGRTDHVVWMPAHCSSSQVGQRRLSDGRTLSTTDLIANEYVDEKAKAMARSLRPPLPQMELVCHGAARLMEAAMWLGRITAYANHFPLDSHCGESKTRHARDSAGITASARARGSKRPQPEHTYSAPRLPGDLADCPRWAAIRARIRDKSAAAAAAACSV